MDGANIAGAIIGRMSNAHLMVPLSVYGVTTIQSPLTLKPLIGKVVNKLSVNELGNP